MSMTVGNPDAEDDLVADINTTPLVDVMLVLLIIFLITIPVVIQSVAVELPKERNLPTQTKPENIVYCGWLQAYFGSWMCLVM